MTQRSLKSAQAEADTVLHFAEELAKAEGVPFNAVRVTNASVSEAIIKQAKDAQCDLICMASHGRKGLSGILLGSETQKVLTNSSIPCWYIAPDKPSPASHAPAPLGAGAFFMASSCSIPASNCEHMGQFVTLKPDISLSILERLECR